jgi:dimethylargininase
MSLALVRRPSPRLAECELTFAQRTPLDYETALTQWLGYLAALRSAGFDCVELPPADDHPDGVFVEDVAIMLGPTAILARPGVATRAGEVDTMREVLGDLGIPVASIEEPGYLEGGDVLKVGTTIYVGRSSRTNQAGIDQFGALAQQHGFTVVPVPVTRVLHLKTALTALPDGTIVGFEPLVDTPAMFPRFLAVPEPEGNAVVVLGHDRVLLSASAPATAESLRSQGLDVVPVAVTEFEKSEGCVTCLSVRIRDR